MLKDVPRRLERLPELAHNLFWTWQVEARELFKRLDPELWEATHHNPVRLLRETTNLEAAAEDAEFVEAYNRSLRDLERLRRIANDPDRPVCFIFAGKAHPADEPAKEFITALYRASAEDFAGHLVILEDYDMDLARHLVQGVDLWLNNPRRPLEASGTSGQKASLNGAPNFSVLDGWWPEAYNGRNGWTLGQQKEYASLEEQDTEDAESLYVTLESSIVPLYYDRGASGVPEGWVAMMKEAIKTVAPTFSTQRMVQDYVRELYVPRAMQPDARR
jgi:glycogen phosphorylase